MAQTIQCTLRDTCSDLTTSDQTNLSRSKNRTASRGAFSRLVVLPKSSGEAISRLGDDMTAASHGAKAIKRSAIRVPSQTFNRSAVI